MIVFAASVLCSLLFFSGAVYGQTGSGWAILAVGLCTMMLSVLYNASRLAKAAEGVSGVKGETLTVADFLSYWAREQAEHSRNSSLRLYVATERQGLLPAEAFFIARFGGDHALVIGGKDDSKKATTE